MNGNLLKKRKHNAKHKKRKKNSHSTHKKKEILTILVPLGLLVELLCEFTRLGIHQVVLVLWQKTHKAAWLE